MPGTVPEEASLPFLDSSLWMYTPAIGKDDAYRLRLPPANRRRPSRHDSRRPPGRARAGGGADGRSDAGGETAFRRATDLGDRARRLVPGVLDPAPPRRRFAASVRLGRDLRLVQRFLHTPLGPSLPVSSGDACLYRGCATTERGPAGLAGAESPGGVLLHAGRAARGHARGEPDPDQADAGLSPARPVEPRSGVGGPRDRSDVPASRRRGARRRVHAWRLARRTLRLRQREVGASRGGGSLPDLLHGRDERRVRGLRRRRRLPPA